VRPANSATTVQLLHPPRPRETPTTQPASRWPITLSRPSSPCSISSFPQQEMKPVVVHAESDRPAEGGPSREQDEHARDLMLTCMETLQCDKYERLYPTAVALWRGLAAVVRKQSHLNKIESSASLINLKQAPRETIADYIDR
jgi:hypothetical protein